MSEIEGYESKTSEAHDSVVALVQTAGLEQAIGELNEDIEEGEAPFAIEGLADGSITYDEAFELYNAEVDRRRQTSLVSITEAIEGREELFGSYDLTPAESEAISAFTEAADTLITDYLAELPADERAAVEEALSSGSLSERLNALPPGQIAQLYADHFTPVLDAYNADIEVVQSESWKRMEENAESFDVDLTGIEGYGERTDEAFDAAGELIGAAAFVQTQDYAKSIGIAGVDGLSEDELNALLATEETPISPGEGSAAPSGAEYIATTTNGDGGTIYLLSGENRTVVYPYGSTNTKPVPNSGTDTYEEPIAWVIVGYDDQGNAYIDNLETERCRAAVITGRTGHHFSPTRTLAAAVSNSAAVVCK